MCKTGQSLRNSSYDYKTVKICTTEPKITQKSTITQK